MAKYLSISFAAMKKIVMSKVPPHMMKLILVLIYCCCCISFANSSLRPITSIFSTRWIWKISGQRSSKEIIKDIRCAQTKIISLCRGGADYIGDDDDDSWDDDIPQSNRPQLPNDPHSIQQQQQGPPRYPGPYGQSQPQWGDENNPALHATDDHQS